MKKLLVCGLLIWMSVGMLQAECDPKNSIAFISSKPGSKRDWIKDFDKLERKYALKVVRVSQLRPFFYGSNGKPKECIDFVDLKRLAAEAKEVFKGKTKQNDPAIYFINAIAGVAKSNPPPKLVEPEAVVAPASKVNEPIKPLAAAKDTVSNGQPSTGFNNASANSGKSSSNDQDELDKKPMSVTGTGTTGSEQTDHSPWLWVSIGLGVLALALGGLAFWLSFLIKMQKIYFDKKSQDDSFALRQGLQTNFDKVSKEKFDRLTIENQDLKRTNDELMRELDKLERQTGTGSSAASTVAASVAQITTSPQPAPPAPEPPPAKAFFLSTPTPTSDGLCTFLDQRKAQFDPTSSLYRFELVNNNESEARFQFESTSGTVSGALAYPDTYLHPACDYTGLDSKATRIETTQPGRAVRQGNVWRVTEKARIKFV